MNRFEQCLSHVLEHEGGYVDDPEDPGGATNMGITRRTLADWRHVAPWPDLPKTEVRNLKRSEAANIYQNRYWQVCGAQNMPVGLDLALFDFAVNSGPRRAVQYLQAIVRTIEDGVVGPRTLSAVERACRTRGVAALIALLCANRMAFLRRLSTYERFGSGWTSRVNAVRRQALADAEIKSQTPTTRKPNMNVLPGLKTYIVAAAMLIAGLAQVLGVDLPGFEDQSALHLMMEAMAVMFLRRGLKASEKG